MTRTDALHEATLLLQVLGDLFGVKRNTGVKERKHEYKQEVGCRINERLPATGSKASGRGCLEPGNQILTNVRQVGAVIATQELTGKLAARLGRPQQR